MCTKYGASFKFCLILVFGGGGVLIGEHLLSVKVGSKKSY